MQTSKRAFRARLPPILTHVTKCHACHGICTWLPLRALLQVLTVDWRLMALVESEVAFRKRCEELEDGLYEKFRSQDISSFSTLAFTLGSPQNPVSDDQMNELANKIHGGAATVGNTALVRRLHFESCTFLMADMKTQVTATDPSEPVRKLPFVEKQTRLEAQKRRITGLLHKTEQQPSHQLIDQVYNMVESGAVLYIHPSKCHSRDHEIQSESKQKSKQILTWEQGALKSTVANALSDIDTSTELKLYFALQRPQPCQCDLRKTRNTTRVKYCACHEKLNRTRPKCCACHEKCHACFENVAKVLRLPRKTMFHTLPNTSTCHEVPRRPRETKVGDT